MPLAASHSSSLSDSHGFCIHAFRKRVRIICLPTPSSKKASGPSPVGFQRGKFARLDVTAHSFIAADFALSEGNERGQITRTCRLIFLLHLLIVTAA